MIVETINLEKEDIAVLEADQTVIIELAKRLMTVAIRKMELTEELDLQNQGMVEKQLVFMPDKEGAIDRGASHAGDEDEPPDGKAVGGEEDRWWRKRT